MNTSHGQAMRLNCCKCVQCFKVLGLKNLQERRKHSSRVGSCSWSWVLSQSPLPLAGKESACNAADPGSIPGLGRSLGEGNGNPLQYSCLENSMDSGVRWTTVMGSQRVGHDWATNTFTFLFPTPSIPVSYMTWNKGCELRGLQKSSRSFLGLLFFIF